MEIVYVVVLGAAVALFVSRPFWGATATSTEDPAIAALEAAREAKYREIRDAETDRSSGKLSQEDFDKVNADLRDDAVGILKELDELKSKSETTAERGETSRETGDS
jgi:hypothetical protein